MRVRSLTAVPVTGGWVGRAACQLVRVPVGGLCLSSSSRACANWPRRVTPSCAKTRLRCVVTVRTDKKSWSAICWLLRPFAARPATARCCGVRRTRDVGWSAGRGALAASSVSARADHRGNAAAAKASRAAVS
jgi:hypothetical protein